MMSSMEKDCEPLAETLAHKAPGPLWSLSAVVSPVSMGSSTSPGSFSSSASCCSSASTDACALLTETDEVLAILDSVVLASTALPTVDNTTTTVSVPIGEGSPVPLVSVHGSTGPATDTSQEQLQSVTVSGMNNNKKRQKTPNEELEQLRNAVQKLEAELTPLHQENRLATRRNQIWQVLASRQFRWRQHAETENQQLKTMLSQVLHATEPQYLHNYYKGVGGVAQMMEMADQLPNHIRGSRTQAIALSARDAAARNSVFETLLGRLDAGFAEIDAVFRENGLDKSPTEPRSYAEKRSRRLSEACQFVELVHVNLVPFDWRRFGDAVWKCTREWYLKDLLYVHPCADRPEDTFAISYRMLSKSPAINNSGHQQSATSILAVRRYWLADRFVMVYMSQSHGENELAGASVSDISYVVASHVSSLSEPGLAPVSVIQSCLHIFPSTGDLTEVDDQEKAQRLLNLVVDVIQEDITHSQRRVDSSLLLQGRRSQCDPNTQPIGDDDEQVSRIRFAFRDPPR